MNFCYLYFVPGFLDPTEVIDGIRQLYTIREGWHAPFPWCEDFHFHIDDIFTRFEVVSRKKTRGTATSNIVKMSAIFQPHEECAEPRTVLIEGRPGMGKTTYCNKVAYDWATKKSEAGDYLPEIKVVLLLKCRDIDSDLWEAIYDQLLSRDIDEKERENFVEFIRHNQSNVLLVLDGLDELPASKLPEFSEIIQGRMLSRCRFVVTARHEAGIAVRKDFDTLLEIEGFTAQDAEDFISKFFKEKEGKLDQKLIDKLTNDKGLQELTASPLNTALLCLLCEDFQGVFPESRTHLYVEIVQCVLRRYRKKKGLAVNFEDLIEVYKTELKHLGKVALNGLHEDSMYFTDKQLGNHTRDLPGFGFLSVESGSSKRKPGTRYGFLHKSFQEFFAAYYLCCQLLSGEISPEGLATDTRYFHQLRQVLLFTFGMLARQSEETAAALIKSITIQVNEDAEKGYAVALDWITECKKEQSDFHLNLARTFGSLLRREFFCFTRQGHVQAAVLAEALQTNTTLTDLSLSSNRLDAAVAAALANALQVNTTLTQLNLSCGNLGAAGADALANALLTNTTLTQLYLSCGNLGAAGADALANALLTNTTLTQLYWSCGNLGAAGADALANSLLTNTTLTHLNLPSDNLGAAGAAALANVLQTNTTLTELNLSKNNLGAAGAAALAKALRTNTTLTWLDLSNNNLFAAGAVELANVLQTNTTLTKLNLSNNKVEAPGAAALANALRTNTTLTELNLSNSNLGAVVPADPATVLKRLITTQPWSYLSSNNLSAAGAAAAVDALQPSETLPELSLFGNNLCAAGAAASVNARQLSATLPGSYLPSSHPFPFGAAYFAAMAAAFQDNTGASALFEALNINTTLSNLYLSKSDFSQSVLKDLKKAHGHRISVVGPFKFF